MNSHTENATQHVIKTVHKRYWLMLKHFVKAAQQEYKEEHVINVHGMHELISELMLARKLILAFLKINSEDV